MRKDIIKPIETEYNGYLFRSKLEAQWAVVFDCLEIRYEYEPEGFELEDRTRYLPDFYFPDWDTYGEVKPDRPGALEELVSKSFKFVENGMIERLIILPNIPAATKKDPVWWVPLIVKDPFVPFPDNVFPFINLMAARAAFDKGAIRMDMVYAAEQIKKGFDAAYFCDNIKKYIDTGHCFRERDVEELHNTFLQAIPIKKMGYVIQKAKDLGLDETLYEEEQLWKTEAIIQAYKKARQARFDHGQTPKVEKSG